MSGSKPAVLVLAAMDVEEQCILARSDFTMLEISRSLRLMGHCAELSSCFVVVLCSGIGCVNAGATLALAAERLPFQAVLLLGVGGALDPSLEIGEMVLAQGVIQHDYFASQSGGNRLMAAGQLDLNGPGSHEHLLMPCDSRLLHKAAAALEARCGLRPKSGLVISGNEFVGTGERKLELARRHSGALLVDMEAAGIAQVALRLNLPFLAAKTVADRVEAEGSVTTEFERCVRAAADNSAALFACLNEIFPVE